MSFRIIEGDCIEAMAAMEPNSVDAIVTDPPYGIRFMGKAWDGADIERAARARALLGDDGEGGRFDGRTAPRSNGARDAGTYDLSPTANRAFQQWTEGWAREALRVLKPGCHLLSSCSTRTYHRMAAGIEDAGFEIRDCLAWLYGSGFPKSLDVSKAIDKAAGAEREVVGQRSDVATRIYDGGQGPRLPETIDVTAPATPDAQHWNGWGTALKPAFEPIVLARKPLSERNVAANVLRWGTGALNIDGTRIETDEALAGGRYADLPDLPDGVAYGAGINKRSRNEFEQPVGRWPANVTLSHSPECRETDQVRKVKASAPASGPTMGQMGTQGIYGKADGERASVPNYADPDGTETVPVWNCAPDCAVAMLDEQSGERTSALRSGYDYDATNKVYGDLGRSRANPANTYGDTGGASRFFYCPKADRAERNNGAVNVHPTVKPIALMAWLCRMVTPKGGTVLDPFTGSGSTGIAALREGFEFIGIEREPAYCEIARDRITGDAPLFNEEVTA